MEQLFKLKNLKELPVDYNFESNVTIPCRIKRGWDGAGRLGQFFGDMYIEGASWSIVLFSGDEDPSLFKSNGLEKLTMTWI